MGTITKEFAESLLKRVQAGKHINTTCSEEEQLIRGWLYWHEHVYLPKVQALRLYQGDAFAIASSDAAQQPSTKESK